MEPTRAPLAASSDDASSPSRRSRRCNADYRWTLPKAMAFLRALAESGSVTEAARAVGMSRQAAYRLKARLADGPLGEGFELARSEGLRARAARSASRWEGPGLDALEVPRQGYAGTGHSNAFGRKVTDSAAK